MGGVSVGKPFVSCFYNPYQQSSERLQNLFLEPIENFPRYTQPQFIVFSPNKIENVTVIDILKQNSCSFLNFHTIEELKEFKADTVFNILLINADPESLQMILPNYSIYQSIDFITNGSINASEKQCINKSEKQSINKSEKQRINKSEKQIRRLKEKFTYRFGQIIKDTPSSIRKYVQANKCHRSTYICNKDMALINRANLVFYLYITGNKKTHSPEHFFTYLNSKGQEGKQLSEKIRKLTTDPRAAGQRLIRQLFKGNSLMVEIIDILKKTKNPGIMPYFGWAYTCIFNFIRLEGNGQKQQNRKKQFYIVENLSKNEIQSIANSTGQSFMFPTFKLGYSVFQDAYKKKRQDKANVIFIVNIPFYINDFLQQVDFGFYVSRSQDKIVFNVQNFFTLDKINSDKNEITITYGSLAKEYSHRHWQDRYLTHFATHNCIQMLNLWDYFLYSRLYVNNQIDLIFSLQMYHKYKDIVGVNLKRTETGFRIFDIQYSQNQNPFVNLNKSTISTAEKMGDCQFQIGNTEEAIQLYTKSVYPQERGRVKLLSLYNHLSKEDQFQKVFKELKQNQFNETYSQDKFLQIEVAIFKILRRIKRKEPARQQIDKCNKMMVSEFTKFATELSYLRLSISSFPLYSLMIQTQIIFAINQKDRLQALINSAMNNENMKEKNKLISAQRSLPLLQQNKKREYSQNLSMFEGTHTYWLP